MVCLHSDDALLVKLLQEGFRAAQGSRTRRHCRSRRCLFYHKTTTSRSRIPPVSEPPAPFYSVLLSSEHSRCCRGRRRRSERCSRPEARRFWRGSPPVKSPEYPECESPSTRRPAGSHWRAHRRWRRPESTPRPFCR